jgi:hypothetical protein
VHLPERLFVNQLKKELVDKQSGLNRVGVVSRYQCLSRFAQFVVHDLAKLVLSRFVAVSGLLQ